MVLALGLGLNLSDSWLKEINSPDLLPQALLKSFPPSLNLLSLIPPLLLLPPPLPCLLVLPPLVQPEQEPPGLLPLESLRKPARNQCAGVFFIQTCGNLTTSCGPSDSLTREERV